MVEMVDHQMQEQLTEVEMTWPLHRSQKCFFFIFFLVDFFAFLFGFIVLFAWFSIGWSWLISWQKLFVRAQAWNMLQLTNKIEKNHQIIYTHTAREEGKAPLSFLKQDF